MKLDKIMNTIQQLQNKTTKNGCTKQEALSAVTKINSLLKKHDLELADVGNFSSAEKNHCKLTSLAKSSRTLPIDLCMLNLTRFCDVKCWIHGQRTGWRTNVKKYQFLGFPADVEAVINIFKIINNALICATIEFKGSQQYQGRSSVNAFQKGFIFSVCDTLDRLKAERNENIPVVKGTELVVVKQKIIDVEFDKLKLNLSKNRGSTPKLAAKNADAYSSGRIKGREFNLNRKVTEA